MEEMIYQGRIVEVKIEPYLQLLETGTLFGVGCFEEEMFTAIKRANDTYWTVNRLWNRTCKDDERK